MARPHNPWELIEERRSVLQGALDGHLIQAFTYVTGSRQSGKPSWVIDTNDGERHTLTSEQVPMAVTMLTAGRVPAPVRPPSTITPYAGVPELLGISAVSLRSWLSTGKFPGELVRNVEEKPGGGRSYADAYCETDALVQWGKSVGVLDPDGEPTRRTLPSRKHAE
jgi:hypothetical protein